ncbi:hypothetical protein EGW08_020350, partial [Elysia chlorotica]
MHDYLPALYTDLVSDPDNFPFVATLNGRMVAFAMVSVLDGGQTTLFKSGRVHKDFRNLILMKPLVEYFHQFRRQGLAPHIYNSTAMTGRGSNSKFLLSLGYQPVLKR